MKKPTDIDEDFSNFLTRRQNIDHRPFMVRAVPTKFITWWISMLCWLENEYFLVDLIWTFPLLTYCDFLKFTFVHLFTFSFLDI